jgi:hypothetical protein
MVSKNVRLFAIIGVLVSLVAAQDSKNSVAAHPAHSKVRSSAQPLAPKLSTSSRAKHHLILPPNRAAGHTAELKHLEKQSAAATTAGNGSAKTVASNTTGTTKKPATDAVGSKIDFKYQQPTGGMKASAPRANARNSNTSRVTKDK